MGINRILMFMLVVHIFLTTEARCPTNALVPLPLVLQYAVWRGWHQAVLYAPAMEQECKWAIVRLVKCLGVNGVGAAVPAATTRSRPATRLGIVILSPELKKNSTQPLLELLSELNESEMTTEAYDVLIAARRTLDLKRINAALNETPIRFDQNVVVAYPSQPMHLPTGLCDKNFLYDHTETRYKRPSRTYYRDRYSGKYYNDDDYFYRESGRNQPRHGSDYYKSSPRYRNLTRSQTYVRDGRQLPLLYAGILTYNYSKTFVMTNASKFYLEKPRSWRNSDRHGQENANAFYLVQYFKTRQNSTLYAHLLGVWNPEQSMGQVTAPYPVEARTFLGEPLMVGRCNTTTEGKAPADDDGAPAPELLEDVLQFLVVQFNATSSLRYYPKLGFRTYEGAWTGLLGALVDGSVDLALEPVSAHDTRHRDMQFVFPIAETMCNIYIRHQETSAVRDIFLAPFSPRLLGCVVGVALGAAAAAVAASRLARPRQARVMGYAEALLWSTGILCQQGGTWTPPSSAASLLLIVCLLFSVVTYNSYAAFITSVLSVRAASLDTVAAVLSSPDFKIGYIQNGADQMYLMSTKDAQLNAFYIRGYSDAANLVSSAAEGLSRAATQDYAFFAGARAARTALRALGQPRGRCALRELPVPSTRTHLAFPLPNRSPYAKPTLMSLVRLRSGGVLARLGAALVPAMPQCAPPAGFASARATDVRTALFLLALGLLLSALLGIGEYCWKNRAMLRKCFVRNFYKRLQNLLN